mgnify:CR=1 FL=1
MEYTESIIQKEDKTMLKIIAAKSHNKESNSASLHGCF